MSDNLRDRIAAAIVGGCPCFDCTAVALEKADAVIEALGLREERSLDGQTVNRDGFSHGGMKHRWVEPTPFHRYVTEWEADDA